MIPPLIGITTDVFETASGVKFGAGRGYADCVAAAGGIPVLLPPMAEFAEEWARQCDGFVFTGGDDPRTEEFGAPTHPKATPVCAERQAFETRLLRVVHTEWKNKPVLGVCLGMQMMALLAGGRLDQHMPETMGEAAGRHWAKEHEVVPVDGPVDGPVKIAGGAVHSRHRQAVDDPGSLVVVARADDGVIEAVADAARRFYVGVQWHPERTAGEGLGSGLFRRLVEAAELGYIPY